MLQREGVLISKHGVGTYVNNRISLIENPLSKLQSLGEMIKNASYEESQSNIRIYTREPESEWKKKLEIEEINEEVVVLERVRTADNEGIAFYYNIFAESLVENKFNENFSGGIFDFLDKNFGIKITYAITEIKAVNPSNEFDKRAIELLGDGIILLKQLHYDEKNKPIFYSIDYLKSDIFKLVIRRSR